MYAVISTGGKQYKVEQGQTLDVELLGREVGAEVTFTPLLVVNGDSVVSGASALSSAKVTAKVVGAAKGPKITGYMYKSKARAQRRWGHRQHYTTLEVTAITA
jgi:large subunit ribosomal protein L21